MATAVKDDRIIDLPETRKCVKGDIKFDDANYSPSNKERAEWGQVAVQAHSVVTHVSYEDRETQLGDLLADLMHYCRYHKIDFAAVLARGVNHHESERKGIL